MEVHEMTDKMRHAHLLVVTSGLFIAAAVIGATGCDHVVDDCTLAHTCPSSASAGGAGGGAGTGGSDAGAGGGGASITCDPTLSSDLNVVDASCGVYVWSNASVTPYLGTNTNPYKTLAAALTDVAGRTNPKLRNVYACNEGTFTEPVVLSDGVTLWGGLNCDNLTWNYEDGSKTALTALAGAIPLTVSGTVDVTVHDFAITADAATALGGSSIAVVVDGATATFTRCDLSAGDAKDGAAGVHGGVPAPQAGSGKKGDDAGAKNASGGSGGTNTCDTNDPAVPADLAGGPGGGGGSVIGGGGGNGGQGDIDKGGLGGDGGSTNLLCSAGQDGSGSTTLVNGLAGLGIGAINASGYHGADGTDGSNGTHGTSGGGGGGTKASMTYGAAGGGGGAGGCGGKLGTKGEAGGSSIALMGLKATVTMNACTLSAGKGGNGGAGGDGQPGQQGGNGGIGGMGSAPSVLQGCDGGKGGKGCDGGNGGGGSGGHSLGIAMAGGMLTSTMPLSAFQPTVSGDGGLGGNMNVSGNKGTKGLAIWCWDFDGTQDGKACMPSNQPPS
jgi:hypothetical protein